ncbi:MAG: iron-sulfur cluster assembly protein [bacterium]|nr:iron-sulfur cluster assembly protein [bacterium]
MKLTNAVKLKKSVSGWLVPAGVPVTLKRGASVEIMQALGDSITLATADGRLVRIDADYGPPALGIKLAEPAPPAGANSRSRIAARAKRPIEELVLEQLRTCYDPEIPVNIVELGLIYEYKITGTKKTGLKVAVTMTLTAVGCGMGEVIAREIEAKIKRLPGVKSCTCTVTFDPPWDQSRMSESARLQLGLL